MHPKTRVVVNGFELLDLVGQGGLGTVWSARHVGEGVAVALKFVTADHTDDPEYRDGFRREVEAAAGLAHPGIVSVFDSGTVDELASLASDGALPTGAPWLAMEYARYGNLANVRIDAWSELRIVLYDVLDALAHAHSRGVIHRDLKPANILSSEDADGQLLLKLSDFGIAHVARHNRAGGPEAAGTPAFMAPEQVLGRWRDYGPWTDLYALGCVAWEMCCGEPPFSDDNVMRVLDGQVNRAPPRFAPKFDLPNGFDRWLDRLLQKSPSARFRHAATARSALTLLDPIQMETERTISVGQADRPTPASSADTASAETLPLMLPPTTVRDVSLDTTCVTTRSKRETVSPRMSVPKTWKHSGMVRHTRTLLSGVGLGLFGLRPIPFVGRKSERDEIWSSLRRVASFDGVAAVVVEGEAGCGKSRLAEWVGERAMELGAARLLATAHDPMTGGTHALRELVLEFVAEGQPLYVWLDDIQWGADAMRFVLDCLDVGWVQRGLLRRTATGFELAGKSQAVPDDIHALWMRRLEHVGSRNVAAARFNLAMGELQSDRFAEAEPMLEQLAETFDRSQQQIPLAATHVALITCAAARADDQAAWRHISAAHPLLEETKLVDPDLEFALARVLELFREQGMNEFVGTIEQMLVVQRRAGSSS